MLKVLSTLLATTVASYTVFASDEDVVRPTKVVTIGTYAWYPYSANYNAVNNAGLTEVLKEVTPNRSAKEYYSDGNSSAATSPGYLTSSNRGISPDSSNEYYPSPNELLYSKLKTQHNNLKEQKATDQLISAYEKLLQNCDVLLKNNPSSDSLLFKAEVLFGLSNVYGKLHKNEEKYNFANQAFKVYRGLNNHRRAKTCLMTMNNAVFYARGNVQSSLKNSLKSLINTCVKESDARIELLLKAGSLESKLFQDGSKAEITLIIEGISLRTQSY